MGKYYKRGKPWTKQGSESEDLYLNSAERDKQLFEEQARSTINETLTIFCR